MVVFLLLVAPLSTGVEWITIPTPVLLLSYSCPTPICFSRPLHLSLSSPTPFGLSPSSSFPTAADEYQELLPKEEEDLQEVLASHENAIQDSERLMEKLSEELSTLDEVGGPRENS